MILTDRAWQLTLTSLFLLNVSSGGSTRSSNGEASLTAFGLIAKKHIKWDREFLEPSQARAAQI